MLTIAIVEDETAIRRQLMELIQQKGSACSIAEFESGDQLLFAKQDFDLIFLDIRMEGINGIETARKLRQQQKHSVIIFVTALKDYVFEAFDVSAFHYLLKPIDADRFSQIFDRAINFIGQSSQYYGAKLYLQLKGRNITVEQKDILYLENHLKKVEIHTLQQTIGLNSSMKILESQLSDAFFRCHRGYLVNMAWISEYDSSTIILKNKEEIYLAREKYSLFKKAYMRYLRNGNGEYNPFL